MRQWIIKAKTKMLSFEYPFLALLLLLPVAAYMLLAPQKTSDIAALKVFDRHQFESANTKRSQNRQTRHHLWLFGLYGLLVLALMRPVWLQDAVAVKQQGRDLMLAIDLSGSMSERDMQLGDQLITRIALTKQVAIDFVKKRQGDRLGLIVFGAYPYLKTPLTFDNAALVENIDRSYTHDADDIQRRIYGTAIGDAIGLALKRLQKNQVEQKVLILITDGSDNSSNIPPLKAAELAKSMGLKIYTIGLGSDRYNNLFTRELDEPMLEEIAKTTGGVYYRARHADELAKIYQEIDRLEPVKSDSLTYRPQKTLYFYPLLAAFLWALLGLWQPLKDWYWGRGAHHAG